eukprot:maker-scaffold483_size159862-snap-gene-0.39 protein:Tk08693 transcript:maker-scaffold483_size159862-snap-gene-0.39-mRNA-1 annotation:"histone deacetylase 8"
MEAIASAPSVCLVESPPLLVAADSLPPVAGRASRVASLWRSFGLGPRVTVVEPGLASPDQLNGFHARDYLDLLARLEAEEEPEDDELDDFGLLHDCPILPGLWTLSRLLAGASIEAAQCLVRQEHQVAINWHGGWHHAHRDRAAGFCYVNDVVLAILELRTAFPRVLYLDLDIHHGDGVEDAFAFSPSVFTVSIHLKEPGYYPGSGSPQHCGMGSGRGFSLNVPLKRGIRDEPYVQIFHRTLLATLKRFEPSAVVCQLGCDGLAGDPLGGFNLTPQAYVDCVRKLINLRLPLLLLGGGGYRPTRAAITWTRVLADIVGVELPTDIPEDDPYFLDYGPAYDTALTPGPIPDENVSADPNQKDSRMCPRPCPKDCTTEIRVTASSGLICKANKS